MFIVLIGIILAICYLKRGEKRNNHLIENDNSGNKGLADEERD